MRFIKDFVGRDVCFECEYCDVSNGHVLPASGLIFQSKDVAVYHKMDCFVKGVIVITTRIHAPYFSNFTTDIEKEIMDYIEIVKKFMIKYGHADDVVVFRNEGNHVYFIIVPKFEREWADSDLDVLGDVNLLKRRGIPTSEPYSILLLTQALKNHFKKVMRQVIKV